MKIIWIHSGDGFQLRPYWIVEFARIHTVKKYELSPGDKRDTLVLYFGVTERQLQKLFDDFGKESVPYTIFGLKVIPLIPNSILWTCYSPKGYEKSIPTTHYTSCEIREN